MTVRAGLALWPQRRSRGCPWGYLESHRHMGSPLRPRSWPVRQCLRLARPSETPSTKPLHNSQRGLPLRPLPRQTLSSGQVPRQALPLPRPEVPGPTPTSSFLAMHTSLLPLLQRWNHSLGAPPVLRTRRTLFFRLLPHFFVWDSYTMCQPSSIMGV